MRGDVLISIIRCFDELSHHRRRIETDIERIFARGLSFLRSGGPGARVRELMARLDLYRRQPVATVRSGQLDPELEARLRSLG